MKEALRRHITDIFNTLKIESSFDVFDCKNDDLPEWTGKIQLTHEFLICCEPLPNKDKLEQFLSKPIFESNNNYCWLEGEQIADTASLHGNQIEEKISTETQTEKLKTKTILPDWLDKFIFKKLNAQYAPNYQRFDYNLELTAEENLKYLGTYFPRSYAESFLIFDNLFQNSTYQKSLYSKDTLNILTIGCGTGGDLIGLLTSIKKYPFKTTTINIVAIDGNTEALNILTKIVKQVGNDSNKKLNLEILQHTFSTDNFTDKMRNNQKFDFILSFKMLNEIISAGKGKYDNAYYRFVKTFAPILTENGMLLILDVTTRQEHNSTFNPILMNLQVNQALAELRDYKTILPLPCNLHEQHCKEICFTQQIFSVSHSQHTNDISKVSYRMIARKDFAESLCKADETAKYPVGRENYCRYTEQNEKVLDAYLLNDFINENNKIQTLKI